MFILRARAQLHAQSLFLFPIVFGINLMHYFEGKTNRATWESRNKEGEIFWQRKLKVRTHCKISAPQWWPFEKGEMGSVKGETKSAIFLVMEGVNSSPSTNFFKRESVNSSPILARQWWGHFRLSPYVSLSLTERTSSTIIIGIASAPPIIIDRNCVKNQYPGTSHLKVKRKRKLWKRTKKNDRFCVHLCTENQCNSATVIAFYNNFSFEVFQAVFTSRPVWERTLTRSVQCDKYISQRNDHLIVRSTGKSAIGYWQVAEVRGTWQLGNVLRKALKRWISHEARKYLLSFRSYINFEEFFFVSRAFVVFGGKIERSGFCFRRCLRALFETPLGFSVLSLEALSKIGNYEHC